MSTGIFLEINELEISNLVCKCRVVGSTVLPSFRPIAPSVSILQTRIKSICDCFTLKYDTNVTPIKWLNLSKFDPDFERFMSRDIP